MDGGCTCAEVRFRLIDRPMVVHACHCTWCQRESGSAFALNAMIETDKLVLVKGKPEETLLPSASGKGQAVLHCPTCGIALWSHFAGAARKVAFVRVGCLDDPASYPPDVHIFTSSKLPWMVLPEGIPSRPEILPSRREMATRRHRQARGTFGAALTICAGLSHSVVLTSSCRSCQKIRSFSSAAPGSWVDFRADPANGQGQRQ